MTDFTHLMFWVLVGHFVGDYLLQSKEMALTKTAKTGHGLSMCLLHCIAYSVAVSTAAVLVVYGLTLDIPLLSIYAILGVVFLSHFPIDRWSLADKWLKMIEGRQLDEVFKDAFKDATHLPNEFPPLPDGFANPTHPRVVVPVADKEFVADVATRQAFTALVYAVVDNTLHFLLMTAGFAALLYFGVIP